MTATLTALSVPRDEFDPPIPQVSDLIAELSANIVIADGHWVWTGPRTPQGQPTWEHDTPVLAVAYVAVHGTGPPPVRAKKLCKQTRCVHPDCWDWYQLAPTPAVDTFAALLGPADGETWQDRANCAGTDGEAFFPEKGESNRDAKRVCAGCKVRPQCLDYAIENDIGFGVWGGMSERERRKRRRRAT